jgi:MarR family transcriptional regulator, multiple antibiotic resistance protein MarR
LSLLYELHVASKLFNELFERERRAAGLEDEAYGLLSFIRVFGPVTPTDLASEFALPTTTMLDAVQRLVDRGYAERVPNPEDRRSYLVAITPTGEELTGRAAPIVRKIEQELERELGSPIGEAIEAVGKIDDALRALLK